MNTPVTSPVTPNVTARHLRINPQTWTGRITMRFDISGCQIATQNDVCGKFTRKAVFLTEEMVNLHTVITAILTVPSLKECFSVCQSHKTCMSFTYHTAQGVQWCTGYSAWIVVPGRIISDIAIFVNQDVLNSYGYKEDQGAAILYNIIEMRKNQVNASASCKTMHTRLIKVDTASKMTSLNNTISGYDVLKHDFRFFVAGVYNSTIWSYSGGIDVINTDFWSPDNPDPGQGHCVMLTQTGLASVDCQQQLFSICGN
ncbi:uncharacterized protein LOC117332774 [Pecten maximus]|uniref:uncharacterized protein LOC117332774 n=1 Tax=Pecten maximus TaxID=6579 RepID=UPI001458CCAC|nr:uncharacterized protein LOC117332774 [Pecten maximus]